MSAPKLRGDPIPEPSGRSSEPEPVRVAAGVPDDLAAVLSSEALDLVGELVRRFGARRRTLLAARARFREAIVAGHRPNFLEESRSLREADWRVAPPPPDLVDRRVEITGPVDRKTIINALNSGASAFMADFEDAHSPTWLGTVRGQANLRDAVRRTIAWTSPDGREYRLGPTPATLLVRPRGWHLEERHLTLAGEPLPASLVDFGLFFAHNARELVARGTGPYVYLPKLEHFGEAGLWDDVFDVAERWAGLPRGSVRATVLIETLPAVFEMDEILFALKDHSAGLNCGRWDYIFSFIKQFRDDPQAVFPDRALLPMTTPFLDAYSRLLVTTCHRRGAHAIGGMAAQIPIKDDPAANAAALAQVRADKEREVAVGHDGTWVAHPGLVPVAREVFARGMSGPNQVASHPGTPGIRADQLLRVPTGPVRASGVRTNVRAALRYLDAWLRGIGCVPIDHRMEDAATVEIARAQLWQWVRYAVPVEGHGPLRAETVRAILAEEAFALRSERPETAATVASLAGASVVLDELVTGATFVEFFPLHCYAMLDRENGGENA